MKIKKLTPEAQLPKKADNGAAGYDLSTPQDYIVKPGRNILPLDFAIAIEYGYEGQVRPRSGFSAKGFEGYALKGQGVYDETPKRFDADVEIGTIDSTYRGNVGVIVISREKEPFLVLKNTRIAQLVIEQCYMEPLEEVNELDATERGEGGFGHTGTR